MRFDVENPEMREQISAKEAAEFLGLGYQPLLRKAKRGEIPSIRYGGTGHFRFEREALESYVEACRTGYNLIAAK